MVRTRLWSEFGRQGTPCPSNDTSANMVASPVMRRSSQSWLMSDSRRHIQTTLFCKSCFCSGRCSKADLSHRDYIASSISRASSTLAGHRISGTRVRLVVVEDENAPDALVVLVGLSTNFIGYGLAGLTRRFLVYPVHAYVDSTCSFLNLPFTLLSASGTPTSRRSH